MDLFDDRAASPMLIAKQAEAFDDPGCIYELKLDGFRCLAYSDKKTVDLRNKKICVCFPNFRNYLIYIAILLIDVYWTGRLLY